MKVGDFRYGSLFFLFILVFVLVVSVGIASAYTNSAGSCLCNACQDCNNALKPDSGCSLVELNQDLVLPQLCIIASDNINDGTSFGAPFKDKVFDCQGHKAVNITLPRGNNVTIQNCEFIPYGDFGTLGSSVKFGLGSNSTFKNNVVDLRNVHVGTGTPPRVLSIEELSSKPVSNVRLENNRFLIIKGMLAVYASSLRGSYIMGNNVTAYTTLGSTSTFSSMNFQGSENNVIQNNYLEGQVSITSGGINTMGNIIENNIIDATKGGDLSLVDYRGFIIGDTSTGVSTNNIIRNNYIVGAKYAGLQIGAFGTQVSGNTVVNTRKSIVPGSFGQEYGFGILVDSRVRNSNFENNVVCGSVTQDIHDDAGSGNTNQYTNNKCDVSSPEGLCAVNCNGEIPPPPPACTDTCSSLGKQCNIWSVCGVQTNCGTCSTGQACNVNGICQTVSAGFSIDDAYWADWSAIDGTLIKINSSAVGREVIAFAETSNVVDNTLIQFVVMKYSRSFLGLVNDEMITTIPSVVLANSASARWNITSDLFSNPDEVLQFYFIATVSGVQRQSENLRASKSFVGPPFVPDGCAQFLLSECNGRDVPVGSQQYSDYQCGSFNATTGCTIECRCYVDAGSCNINTVDVCNGVPGNVCKYRVASSTACDGNFRQVTEVGYYDDGTICDPGRTRAIPCSLLTFSVALSFFTFTNVLIAIVVIVLIYIGLVYFKLLPGMRKK